MSYFVIKRYGHEQGFSCCFRQYNAKHSHCQHLHGYALAFELEFMSEELDNCNWVIDFGGLDDLKAMLAQHFDHTLAVDQNDPYADHLCKLKTFGLADPVLFDDGVGCECFARFVYRWVATWLSSVAWNKDDRVQLTRVRVSEHNGNHAEFFGDPQEA